MGTSADTLNGPNRLSPIASVQRARPTLAGLPAVPSGTSVIYERAPIARCESRQNERRDCFLRFEGRYDRQGTLAIQIVAVTLASDSPITITRFRPHLR